MAYYRGGFNQKKNLTNKIIELTRNFTTEDFFKCRKDRNWEKFDQLSEEEKLNFRLAEISDFLNQTDDIEPEFEQPDEPFDF
jgi:hypothetical protein